MADGQYKFSIGLDDKQLSLDIETAAKLFDQLVKEAQKAGVKIDEALINPFDELLKNPPQLPPLNVPTNVPQTTQQFKGLNLATQQLVRELPAATMGLNTFFLAVSNNLPIFTDQIKAAKEANKELVAQGKPTTSVFKQIIGSLFSWQTALVAGITILTMYGKEIGEWIANLFKSKDALSAAEKAQKGLNSAIKEQGLGIGDDIVKLKELQRTWLSLGNDMTARNKFILDNKAAFDDLGVSISNVAEADSLFINNTRAFIQALMLRAQASAAQKLAEEKYEEFFRKRQEYVTERDAGVTTGDRFMFMAAGIASPNAPKTSEAIMTAEEAHQRRIQNIKREAKEIKNEADAIFDLSVEYNNNANELLKAAGFMPFGGGAGNGDDNKNIVDEQKKVQDELTKLAADGEEARTELTIAKMEEGLEKEKAEINKRYDEKARLIDEREKDLKKSIAGTTDGELSQEQKANFQALRDLNEQQRNEELAEADKAKLQAAKKSWNEYLIAYGTFQEKLLATTEKYADLIANAQNEGERKMYEAERDAILAQFEVEASAWAKSLVDKSVKELKVMAEGLQSVVDSLQAEYDAMGSSDTQEAKGLLETINYLNAQIAQLKERLGEAKNSVDNDTWKDSALVFQGISSSANDIANSLENIDAGAAQAIRTMGQMAGVVGNMITAITALTTATTVLQGALGLLGIIAAALSAISLLFNAFERNAEAAREATNAIREYERALDDLESREIKSAHSGIFGSDDYSIFVESLAKAKEQLLELEEIRKEFSKAIFADSDMGIINMGGEAPLIADMRTGWQKFWGTGDENIKITGLDEFYENGVLNLDKLKAYYDSYKDYMNEEQADLVKQLIEKAEDYEENMASVKEYMTGLFGELGDDITKSIVDAFANGTDAAQAFKDSVSDIMRNFASDLVEAMYIAPLLEQAQADVEAIWNDETLSHEQKLAAIAARMAQLGRELKDTEDDIDETLGYIDRTGKDNGFDIFSGGDRQGSTKGIAQASQDSIDELNGRATAIQGHTYSLAQGQKQLINDSAQALKHLAGIELNTSRLHNIERTIDSMAGDISQMALRGVKMI